MDVRNIKVYRPLNINVELPDGETITVSRVPAIATAILYSDETLMGKLLKIGKKPETKNDDKIAMLADKGREIVCIVKDHYDVILEIITITLKRDKQWVIDNLGHNDMIQIVLAIMLTQIEESADIIKKNNNLM